MQQIWKPDRDMRTAGIRILLCPSQTTSRAVLLNKTLLPNTQNTPDSKHSRECRLREVSTFIIHIMSQLIMDNVRQVASLRIAVALWDNKLMTMTS